MALRKHIERDANTVTHVWYDHGTGFRMSLVRLSNMSFSLIIWVGDSRLADTVIYESRWTDARNEAFTQATQMGVI